MTSGIALKTVNLKLLKISFQQRFIKKRFERHVAKFIITYNVLRGRSEDSDFAADLFVHFYH